MDIGILLYLLLGAGAGFLAGLLGIGGGVIVVPGLAYIFAYRHIANNLVMHLATGTSLAAIFFTMIAAVLIHTKNKNIQWNIVWQLLPGTIIGAILGVSLAVILTSSVLKIIFGIFLVLVALHLFFQKKAEKIIHEEKTKVSSLTQKIAGFVIGIASGLLGVGGGVVAVPILLRFGLTSHQAAATSSSISLFVSIVGAMSFIIAGWTNTELPAWSTGYVYWPAVAAIAITSFLFVPLGTKLAKVLSADNLKRVFAVFLLLVGLDMLIRW